MMDDYDIVFINPTHHGPDYYSPIGIGILQQIVENRGFTSCVLDFQRQAIEGAIHWPEGFFDEVEDQIRLVRTGVFAFSVMNVGLPWAVRIADICRKLHPASVILFGGPHPTLAGEQLMSDFPVIDVIARREGESIIVPLLDALLSGDCERLGAIPNLLFRSDKRLVHTIDAPFIENLDDIPMPKLDAYLLANVGIASVEAGRGCPYHCSFCSSHAIWSRKPRFKSPRRLVQEGARLASAVPDRPEELVISFEHDDFLANRPWFLQFIELKRQCRVPYRYGITARVNHITPAIAKHLKDSGCVSVFMGLETGSERIQSSSSKHLRTSDILPRVENLIRLGIHISTNFIVGFPDETWEDLTSSFELMLAVKKAGGDVNISVMCPEPGSALGFAIPEMDQLLLADGPKCEELRRGGIDPQLMKRSETLHLRTVRNGSFDILEIAALARCMQLLMAEYPIAVASLLDGCEGAVGTLIRKVHAAQRTFGEVTHRNAFELVAAIQKPLSPSLAEMILYEHAKAAHKRGEQPTVPLDAFREEVPSEYLALLSSANRHATQFVDGTSYLGGVTIPIYAAP